MNPSNEILIFITCFVISATSGIAASLRSGKAITKLSVITAGLNSGLLGLSISLLWYKKFQDNLYTLIGICVISGLTGAAGFDAILTSIQRGAFKINLSTELEDKDKEKPKEG